MTWTYISKQMDTFDLLAHDIYGSEMLAYILLQANPKYHDLIYLPAGLTIIVPQTPKSKLQSNQPRPPWIE